jgi:hypothetical protein
MFQDAATRLLSYVSVRANSRPGIKGTPRIGCTPSSARSGGRSVGGCIEVDGTLARLRRSEGIETVAESPPAVALCRFCPRGSGPSAATIPDIVGTPMGTMQFSAGAFGSGDPLREIYLHAIPKEQWRALESVEGMKFGPKFVLPHRCIRNNLVKIKVYVVGEPGF